MKRHIIFLLSILIGCAIMQAQTINVTGTVTGPDDDPIPGVVVSITGKAANTITDIDGVYHIKADKGETLEFQFVGMKRHSVTVGSKSTIDVKMEAEANMLDEVVAIGYGVAKKSDLTGAVSSIKSEDLSNVKIGTVTSALQGLATGVQVTTGSTKPGGDASVIIRGVGTINAGSTPLFIVDGVPVQGGLQDLSASDIESIEVLKDASSASIYGSRGSNGVVIVTTKKGERGKARVTVNATYGIQKMLNKQDLMNAQQYYELVSMAKPDYKWTSAELRLLSRGESTDWQDAVTQDGSFQNYNVSISGGNKDTNHFFGVDWYDQTGTIRNSSFEKLTVRYNMDSKINDWLSYGIRANFIESKLYNINEEKDPGYGTFHSAITAQPTAPIFNEDGSYFDGFLNTKANPVAIVDLLDHITSKTRIVGSAYVEIEPVKNLKIRSDNGGEVVMYRVKNYEDGRMGQHYNASGHANVMTNKKTYFQTENTVTYGFNINEKHKFSVMGGFSASKTHFEEVTADSKDLSPILKYNNLGGAAEHGPNASYAVSSSLVSFYGRLNYNFDNRYLATVTMRGDGSSKFAPGHRWGYFPSLALAWRASEESFIKDNTDVLSNLKLRVSIGRLGNQNISEFDYAARVALGGSSPSYILGDALVSGSVQTSIPNPDLTWEKANQVDLGLDFGLFNNRISGTIETYYKRTTDLLFSVPLPLESGYGTSLTNIGKVDNKGIEFSINTLNINKRDLTWTTSFMISYNVNKVKELYDGKTDINKWLFVGRPLSQIYTMRSLGVWQSNEAAQAARYNAQPGDRKVLDADRNGAINGEDRQFCGQYAPKYFGSFTSTLTFKGFDLTAFFTFAGGHKINNSLRAALNSFNTGGNMSANYYKYYWRQDRPNNKYPAPRIGSAYANGDGTDANLQKGDYLRLRNLELGYTLPETALRAMRMTKLRVFFSVQNVFTATEFTGFDVESSDNTNPYPNARSFIGGISVNF